MANDSKNSSLIDRVRNLFAVDARSLAIVRILIAAILFVQAFYSFRMLGIQPSEMANVSAPLNSQGEWSLCWFNASNSFVWVCIAVNLISSICLFAGVGTFVATAVCLVITSSLQVCNPSLVAAGNGLLRIVLFWGLFLPWGSYWSVDSWKYKDPRPAKWTVVSCGTAGIMLQLAYVYFFLGIASKLNGFQVERLVQTAEMNERWFGGWIANSPALLETFFPFVLIVFIVGSVLLFVPYLQQYCRGVMMALMLLGHIAVGTSLRSGIFPMVAIATWFVFVPGSVWNFLLGTPPNFERDQRVGFTWLRRGWQGVGLVFVVFVLALNIHNVTRIGNENQSDFDILMDRVANITMTQQNFRMFARTPRAPDDSRAFHEPIRKDRDTYRGRYFSRVGHSDFPR